MKGREVALDILSELSGKPIDEIRPSMHLVGDLDIDSPKALQLLVELEDRLGFEITDEAAAAMDTVGDVFDFLAAQPVSE